MDRLLWKARSKGHAAWPRSLSPYQIRHHTEAPGCGCGEHPAFPAPSDFRRDIGFVKLGRISVARGRRCGLVVRDARPCRVPHHEGLRPHPEELAKQASLG